MYIPGKWSISEEWDTSTVPWPLNAYTGSQGRWKDTLGSPAGTEGDVMGSEKAEYTAQAPPLYNNTFSVLLPRSPC